MKEQGVVDQPQTLPRDSKRLPFVPRLVAAWRGGWRAATATWREYPSDPFVSPFATTAPHAVPRGAVRSRIGSMRQRLATPAVRRRLAIGLIVFVVVIASCGALNIGRTMDALAAARDAKGQVAAMQAAVKGGGTTDPARLREVQTHLDTLASDIRRLQADVPFEPVLASTPGVSSPIHLLRLASDLVQAGQAAMPAAIILAPHLKEITASLQGTDNPATAPTSTTPQAPPLTTESVQQAAASLDRAVPFLQAALIERPYVNDTELRLLGLSKLAPVLHQLDAYAPMLPKALNALHAIANALPMLLGVGQPTNFILFSLDSDELRPTGGFMGNYAMLTLSGGKFTNGVHLHDIYSLDCPRGQTQCPTLHIPDRFAWMNVGPDHFGLRDSNLDPDYPASARLAEQMLVQQDAGPAVQGVFSITPRVIEQLLQVTGPITIVSYCTRVTAENLRDVIHYYHMSTPLGITSWCPGPQTVSGNRKAFDAELGSVLLHRVAILPSAQQSQLAHALLEDFVTRDIQLYFNDPGLESVLTSFGVDGAVQSPRGDSLFVVDTNTGANYANMDVQQHATDTISLDAHGTATHDLTLTYTYPKTSHLFTDVYEAELGYWTYRDFARVIVPQNAHFIGQDGCPPTPTDEPGHLAWGCSILFSQPNSVTLRFRWSVPGAATVDGNTIRYTLLIQHEAGTRNAVSVTITPPTGYQLGSAPQPPLTTSGSHQAQYDAVLSRDQALSVAFSS